MITERKQTKKWTTGAGEKVRICDMGDRHLVNTMKLLTRVAERERHEECEGMMSCPEPTADIASMMFQQAFQESLEATWWDFIPDIFYSMLEDYRRRGLEDEELDRLLAGTVWAKA